MGGETSKSGDDEPRNSNGHRTTKKSRKTIIKAKHRFQKYRPEWEKLPDFRNWLQPEEGSIYKAKCIYCNSTMTAEITVIKNHASGAKHQSRCKDVRPGKQQSVAKFAAPPIDEKVSQAEIKLCAFLAAHNISFSTIDHLCDVLKSSFVDSKIVQELKMKRTKATAIIKNVIGESQKECMIRTLKSSKFSIMVDESTDISVSKTMCEVVRFYDKNVRRIVSRFWDLVQVFGEETDKAADSIISATAAHLYNKIVASFDKHDIPRENVIGFGSDGCNTMMGSRNSVFSRLRNDFPGIVIMKCVCHLLHLCDSEACKTLPRVCEDLAWNIYNYFKSSSKRQCKLQQFQAFLELDILKILHPSQTRWLSVAAVVDRIFQQWDALRLFFDYEHLHERTKTAIHTDLHCPFIKTYYLFLQWALPKFTNLNKYFQSETVIVTNVHERMTLAFRDLLRCFMDHNYLARTPLHRVNPASADYFIPLNNLYLGVKVGKQLQMDQLKSRPDLVQDLKMRCREFLSQGCIQLQNRYNFEGGVLEVISWPSPKSALPAAERERTLSITPLVSALPRIIAPDDSGQLQKIDDEWRQMIFLEFPDEITSEMETDVFWTKVLKHANSSGEPYLIVLPIFALNALCIPHSNAQCERVFSKVNLIKTKSRNRNNTDNCWNAP